LHDVYESMNTNPSSRAQELQSDADQARANGNPDHSKEIQAIQARKEAGQIKTDTQYRTAAQKEMKQIQQDWKNDPPDQQEAQDTRDQLERLFKDMKYQWSEDHELEIERRLLASQK
jgi:hypothetical protein